MIDYMVMEAVAIKVAREEEKARKDAKRRQQMEETRKQLVKQHG